MSHSFRCCCVFLVVLWAAAALVDAKPAMADAPALAVKILVDDDEPAKPAVWKKRLGERLSAASAIIQQYAYVRFEVSEFGIWRTTPGINDFDRTLREFERAVNTDDVHLAIGFTSQYQFRTGRQHMGGIRGPLARYILLRESNPRAREEERLEALVHELGHHLGAAHSAEPTSVMRPLIGEGRARLKDYRFAFDETNAKIIRLVAQEVAHLDVVEFPQLSAGTRKRLRAEYLKLVRELPRDTAAKRYVEFIDAVNRQNGSGGIP